jgi:hypothetical protein
MPAAVAVVTTPPHTATRDFYRETPFAFLLAPMGASRTQGLAVAGLKNPQIDAGLHQNF